MTMQNNAEGSRHAIDTEVVIPLHIEELSVAHRDIVRGTVRVNVRTHSSEQVIDELLTQERVEIERVPIGRTVESVPDVRDEGDTTIIPIVEETIVIERRLVLKEEVHIRRVRTVERYSETVTLRAQVAEIARIGPVASGPDNPHTPTEEPQS